MANGKRRFGKAEELAAFGAFCDAFEDAEAPLYFGDLIAARSHIEANIKDDFPPFLGVFVEKAVFDDAVANARKEAEQYGHNLESLRGLNERLHEANQELRRFDVRLLRAELQNRLEEHEAIGKRIKEIQDLVAE